MARYTIDGQTLTDIADAIRTQYGEESPIAVTDMAEAILGIEGGGGGELPIDCEIFGYTPTTNEDSITIDNPRDYMPKLGVIYSEEVLNDGAIQSVIYSFVIYYPFLTETRGNVFAISRSTESVTAYSGADCGVISLENIIFSKRPQYMEQVKYRQGYEYTIILIY